MKLYFVFETRKVRLAPTVFHCTVVPRFWCFIYAAMFNCYYRVCYWWLHVLLSNTLQNKSIINQRAMCFVLQRWYKHNKNIELVQKTLTFLNVQPPTCQTMPNFKKRGSIKDPRRLVRIAKNAHDIAPSCVIISSKSSRKGFSNRGIIIAL